jgi:hypothetical protein
MGMTALDRATEALQERERCDPKLRFECIHVARDEQPNSRHRILVKLLRARVLARVEVANGPPAWGAPALRSEAAPT